MSILTEKQKMLLGQLYNCLDPQLKFERQQAKALLCLYNQSETVLDRHEILQKLLGGFGQDSIIEPPFYCSYGSNIYLGQHVFLNVQCTILDCNQVRIGSHVMMGPAVQIYTAAHHIQAELRIQGLEVARSIVIEDNVWIGGAAVLLPGVCVGRNAVVGAGAVVIHDVPPNTVVAGNPARIIRQIESTN